MIQKVLDSKFQVKTFSVKYNKELSKRAKIVLQSFKLKFYYYVIDDILYFLKSDSKVKGTSRAPKVPAPFLGLLL